MINRAVAKRYARALIEETGTAAPAALAALTDLDTEIRGHAHLEKLLYGGLFSTAQRLAVFEEIAGKLGMPKAAVNLVKILIVHNRTRVLPVIIDEFQRLADEKAGIARAQIASASELSGEIRSKLQVQLERIARRKVECSYALDPNLIGGVRARIGDTVLDGTVRTQLQKLSRRIEQGT